MADAFIGGYAIIAAGWLGRRAVYVDLRTSETGRLYQLYAGRSLIGASRLIRPLRIIGQIPPAGTPSPLIVVSISPTDIQTDFGPKLPRRPWSRYEIGWTTGSYDADAHHFDVTGATAAGEAVDSSNVLGRVPYIGDGSYLFKLPPVATSGSWQFAVAGRDDAKPLGNAGTARTASIDALVYPPDVTLNSDGTRMTADVAAGTVTIGFDY